MSYKHAGPSLSISDFRDVTTGRYFPTGVLVTRGTLAAAHTIDTLRLYPILPRRGVMDRFGFYVSTGGGAGSVARCGIYRAASRSAHYPLTLVQSSVEHDTTLVQLHETVAAIQQSPWDMLYFALITGVAQPTVRGHTMSNESISTVIHGNISPFNGNAPLSIELAMAYGPLPATLAGPPSYATSGPTSSPGVLRYSA